MKTEEQVLRMLKAITILGQKGELYPAAFALQALAFGWVLDILPPEMNRFQQHFLDWNVVEFDSICNDILSPGASDKLAEALKDACQ